jgi:hypothetical protein
MTQKAGFNEEAQDCAKTADKNPSDKSYHDSVAPSEKGDRSVVEAGGSGHI